MLSQSLCGIGTIKNTPVPTLLYQHAVPIPPLYVFMCIVQQHSFPLASCGCHSSQRTYPHCWVERVYPHCCCCSCCCCSCTGLPIFIAAMLQCAAGRRSRAPWRGRGDHCRMDSLACTFLTSKRRKLTMWISDFSLRSRALRAIAPVNNPVEQ